MASLLENTSRIANSAENIKTSLLNKGAEFLEGEKIDTYSSKIDSLNVIKPGNYNVECYIRIDDVLVGEGIEFNVVGTDGSRQTATSRSAGFVYLTLNYGVGYDVQPVDTEKYYANSHELIYHRKEDGNYFATDYFFYTAGSGIGNYQSKTITQNGTYYPDAGYDAFSDVTVNCEGSEDWKLTTMDYLFYNNMSTLQNFDNIIKHIDFENITSFSYFFSSTLSVNYLVDFSIVKKFFEKDLTNITNINRSFNNYYKFSGDTTLDIYLPNCKKMEYFFSESGKQYSGAMLIVDFHGSTGNITSFSNSFSSSTKYTTYYPYIKEILNLNMDSVTNPYNFLYNNQNATRLTFDGSFGGKSSEPTQALNLSTWTSFTVNAFLETMQTISANTNGNTRIIKLSSSLYNSLTNEILDLANEKGYTLSS